MLGEYWRRHDRILWHLPRTNPRPDEARAAIAELFRWCEHLGPDRCREHLVGIDLSYAREPDPEWIQVLRERYPDFNPHFAGHLFVSPNPWLRALIRASGLRLDSRNWHTFRTRADADRWLHAYLVA